MDNKVKISKNRKVPITYVPKGLTAKDKKKQIESILKQEKRPKVESFKSKRSPNVEKFEKKFGYKVSNKSKVTKNLISLTGYNKIIDKGRGAYFSSGSRPNQTPESWALARLASALTFGPSAKIDKDILLRYGKGSILKEAEKRFKQKKIK